MRGVVLAATVLLPTMVWAQAPMATPREERREERRAERLERSEQRSRLRRVLELTDALELDNAQALKVEDTLRRFDEKRRPLREQVREAARTLILAAQGDNAALAQADAAAQRAFEARAQILAMDRDLYAALAKELPAQKRARLALALARAGNGRDMKLPWKAERGGDD
ncbi:hypothetical protein JGU66_20035 [Myxococcaceae bacterium JPH2]|nr:hypothetical protein [Myxococcaceae bacterium JPH2]